MIKLITLFSLFVVFSLAIAESQSETASFTLKHINGKEVVSVLRSLIDNDTQVSESNNVLLISGNSSKIKNILQIIKEMDQPPTPLTIEFIASSHKINFNNQSNTLEFSNNKNNTSQSMSITERQWVTLNTGLSIPIAQRTRSADGTETQSFRYKKVSKRYVFKVHEFSGWSVIQVGMNASALDNSVAGAIKHTKLDTTIVGQTGDWLEVASSNIINNNIKNKVYSTRSRNKNFIHLYVKVKTN